MPKQLPNFDVSKRNALGKLDKSPKGSLDAPIAPLVHEINAHADYVTTSTCSGRAALVATSPNPQRGFRGSRWLLVEHRTVTAAEVQAQLDAGLAAIAAEAADGGSSDAPPPLVCFKLEPAILHVQCRDVDAAKRLLQAALAAGFRESGLVLSNSEKVMLAIRTTANSLELPLHLGGRQLVGGDALDALVAHANGRFDANTQRIDALHNEFRAACAPPCAECEPPAVVAAEPEEAPAAPAPPELPAAAAAPTAAPDDPPSAIDADERRRVGVAASATTRHYVNLSCGAEALEALAAQGVDRDALRFARVQSSHCENRDYGGVLASLDADLLLHLALGCRCRVYDFGSRRKRWPGEGLDLCVPSAIWWGLEVARYALSKLWGLASPPPPLLHGHDSTREVDHAIARLPAPLSRRLKYYRRWVATPVLRLEGCFAPSALDGKDAAIVRALWRGLRLDEATADGAEPEAPPPPDGMRIFEAAAYVAASPSE